MQVRVATYQDLPEVYKPATIGSGIRSPYPDLRFRLVRASGRYDKRSYWAGKGLEPVRRGSGLVENEDAYQSTADGVLRIGTLEVWVERLSHYQGRVRELVEDAEYQNAQIERLVDEAKEASKAADMPLTAFKRAVGVEVEGVVAHETEGAKQRARQKTGGNDKVLPTESTDAGLGEESNALSRLLDSGE